MFNYVHAKISNFLGRNTKFTPVGVITDQIMEKRPMPIGVKEFEEWSDRIIQGSMVKADVNSQKFALAAMLTQLGHRETFKEDAHFITALRKSATDQTAQYIMNEIKTARTNRPHEQQSNSGAVTPQSTANEVLQDACIQKA